VADQHSEHGAGQRTWASEGREAEVAILEISLLGLLKLDPWSRLDGAGEVYFAIVPYRRAVGRNQYGTVKASLPRRSFCVADAEFAGAVEQWLRQRVRH